METKDKIAELESKLRKELGHWINSLPHYSNMQLILEQYSNPYLERVNVINNISINADKVNPEFIDFLLKENHAIDLLLKIKKCSADDLYEHSTLKYYQK